MKVLAVAADKGGCGFYRVAEPARVAELLGVDITVDFGVDVEATMNVSTGLVEVTEVHTDADLIIFQRPLDNSMTAIIKQAKKQGIATIVELDDDFDSVSPLNAAHESLYNDIHQGAHWIHEACKEASWVTVSTPALEKYGDKDSTSVLRNCVPESILSMDISEQPAKTIGWSGTVQTHPTDLQDTKGALNSILTETHPGYFSVVGDGVSVAENLGLDESVEIRATGWVPREQYLRTMSTAMSVGIVPLEISTFNQAKSNLKGLEMAALGIPFVASPTREYLRLEAYGIGKIASSPGDWRRHVNYWLHSEKNRQRDAQQYRETIYDNFTYERSASDWVTVWERAIASSRKNLT